jgi:hypothetical protein
METANGMPYRLHRPPPPPQGLSVQAYLLSLISSLKSQQTSQVGALPILSLHGDGGATYIFFASKRKHAKDVSNLIASRRETHAKLISFRFVMLQSTQKI